MSSVMTTPAKYIYLDNEVTGTLLTILAKIKHGFSKYFSFIRIDEVRIFIILS